MNMVAPGPPPAPGYVYRTIRLVRLFPFDLSHERLKLLHIGGVFGG